MRTAVIETRSGLVANVIELEANANWNPPFGHTVRAALDGGPGDTWNGTAFVKPPPLPPPPLTAEQQAWAATVTPTQKLEMLAKALRFIP